MRSNEQLSSLPEHQTSTETSKQRGELKDYKQIEMKYRVMLLAKVKYSTVEAQNRKIDMYVIGKGKIFNSSSLKSLNGYAGVRTLDPSHAKRMRCHCATYPDGLTRR